MRTTAPIGGRILAAAAAVTLAAGLTACSTSGGTAAAPAPSGSAQAAPGELSVAWIPYPPYSSPEADASGRPTGLATDMGEAMAKNLGVKLKFVRTSFASLIPGVQAGRFGIAMTGTTDTPARSATVDIVDWINDGEALVYLRGNPHQVSRGNLCGKTIAAVAGTTFANVELPGESKKCTDAGKQKVEVLTFPSLNDAVAALHSGRTMAFIEGAIPALARAKDSHGDLEAGEPYNPQPIGILVQKGTPMVERVRAALQKLVDSGEYRKIMEQHGVAQYSIQCITVNLQKSSCKAGA
ncbi:ABC transporter substrate-binding protein [Amycolatopsis jejuensis]|uniref:ABC transporter substrate-binding protein n=1 Tax=Amycolatopsis jejuensis TaxID=330084 RepID=UPI00138E4F02|nr:ABC transporter substrate-binding protein [Amycolatopsis jejuensis]